LPKSEGNLRIINSPNLPNKGRRQPKKKNRSWEKKAGPGDRKVNPGVKLQVNCGLGKGREGEKKVLRWGTSVSRWLLYTKTHEKPWGNFSYREGGRGKKDHT